MEIPTCSTTLVGVIFQYIADMASAFVAADNILTYLWANILSVTFINIYNTNRKRLKLTISNEKNRKTAPIDKMEFVCHLELTKKNSLEMSLTNAYYRICHFFQSKKIWATSGWTVYFAKSN